MDTRNYRDRFKDIVLQQIEKIDLLKPDWDKEISEWRDQSSRCDILWFLKDWVQEGKYIDIALAISEKFSYDPSPEAGYDHLNEKIEKGEDPRNIYTVRGTVPWLLQAIIGTFQTQHYGKILNIVERLADDSIFYVRQQATVPLSLFAANIRARQNKDGTPFNFTDEDRTRTFNLAFKMLRDNRHLPRVLEYVSNVFDKLRYIDETLAKEVLTTLFYTKEGKLNPSYLVHHVAPFALFYAEFRKTYDSTFKNEWFQEFLLKAIRDSNDSDPQLKSTFVWNTWKIIQDNPDYYILFKKYIPVFFEGNFEQEPVGQFEFLVKEVLKISPEDGVNLLKQELDYVLQGVIRSGGKKKVWFTTLQDTLDEVAKLKPKELLSIFSQLDNLLNNVVYIGDVKHILSLYKSVPDTERPALEKKSIEMFNRLKVMHPEWQLTDLS